MRVRRGVVWCVRWDTVRWDMERCGAARYGVVCEVGYGEVWCGGMRWRWEAVEMGCGEVRYGEVWCGEVWCGV